MPQTTPRQTVYNIAAGYKVKTGDTDEINYGNVVDKVLGALNEEYQYPSYWPDIRTNTTDDIVLLVADINSTVSFLVQGGTNNLIISIDWGDGTVETGLQTNVTNVYKGMSVSRTYLARHTYATQGTEDSYNTYTIKINKTGSSTNIYSVRVWGADDIPVEQSWLALKINTDKISQLPYLACITNQNVIGAHAGYLEYVDISACINITTMVYAFWFCKKLQKLILPNTMTKLTNLSHMCRGCSALQELTIPEASLLATMGSICAYCYNLKKVTFRGTSYPALYDWSSAFPQTAIEEFTFPATINTDSTKTGVFTNTFQYCFNLTKLVFPTNNDWADNVVKWSSFLGYTNIKVYDMSGVSMANATDLSSMYGSPMCEVFKFPKAPKVTTVATGSIFISTAILVKEVYFPTEYASTSHAAQTWDLSAYRNLTKLHANCGVDLQRFLCYGYSAADKGYLHDLVLPPNATFGGTSPQINIKYQAFNHTELVALLTYLGTLGLTGKTIDLTGCVGTSELTAAEKALATGWTVTV